MQELLHFEENHECETHCASYSYSSTTKFVDYVMKVVCSNFELFLCN